MRQDAKFFLYVGAPFVCLFFLAATVLLVVYLSVSRTEQRTTTMLSEFVPVLQAAAEADESGLAARLAGVSATNEIRDIDVVSGRGKYYIFMPARVYIPQSPPMFAVGNVQGSAWRAYLVPEGLLVDADGQLKLRLEDVESGGILAWGNADTWYQTR